MVYIHLERWFATRDNLATPPPGDLTMSRDNPVVTTLRTERVVPGISQVETHYTVKHPSGHGSGAVWSQMPGVLLLRDSGLCVMFCKVLYSNNNNNTSHTPYL